MSELNNNCKSNQSCGSKRKYSQIMDTILDHIGNTPMVNSKTIYTIKS